MSEVLAVPSAGTVRVVASGPVLHLCPHVDEVDSGTVELAWTTSGATVELHSLAGHLASYGTTRISHEELADSIAAALDLPGIADVAVAVRFATAGLDVEVSSAVPGDPIHAASP